MPPLAAWLRSCCLAVGTGTILAVAWAGLTGRHILAAGPADEIYFFSSLMMIGSTPIHVYASLLLLIALIWLVFERRPAPKTHIPRLYMWMVMAVFLWTVAMSLLVLNQISSSIATGLLFTGVAFLIPLEIRGGSNNPVFLPLLVLPLALVTTYFLVPKVTSHEILRQLPAQVAHQSFMSEAKDITVSFGEDDAQLEIVVFSEYQCGACNLVLPYFLEAANEGLLRMSVIEFPMSTYLDSEDNFAFTMLAKAHDIDEEFFTWAISAPAINARLSRAYLLGQHLLPAEVDAVVAPDSAYRLRARSCLQTYRDLGIRATPTVLLRDGDQLVVTTSTIILRKLRALDSGFLGGDSWQRAIGVKSSQVPSP